MSKTDSYKNTVEWNQIKWRKVEKAVFKLQKRIYQASKNGDVKKLRRLQKTLINSYYAKLLSVRKVSQDNNGKKTAGVDGVKSPSQKQRLDMAQDLKLDNKSQPIRRAWIPKSPGKERPLGIPTLRDRAKQTLIRHALEPQWEAIFENNSYGFRPGRSCHDAIGAIFTSIKSKDKYVLDADISKYFDRINHTKLLTKINTFPKARRQIKAWLKAGILEKGKKLFPKEGTPQGGALSPLLANIALHGMESIIKEVAANWKGNKEFNKKSISLIRYADDFVIIHKDLSAILQCKEVIQKWLTEIGLELNQEKTKILHTLKQHNSEKPGFNFLGFNIRQYPTGKYHSAKNTNGELLGFKTIIKPSKEKVKKHYQRLAEIVNKHKAAPQHSLIAKLAPVIKGWCNYYSTVCSKDTFSKIDHLLFWKLVRWGYRRHPSKGQKWCNNKYFGRIGNNNWRFKCVKEGKESLLPLHSETSIERYVKVKSQASIYNGDTTYWASRMGKYPEMKASKARLLKKQKGKCNHCKLAFKHGDIIESDHIIPLKAGGQKLKNNLQALHKHCHDAKTKTDLVAIKRYKNRQKWNKVHRQIQKQFLKEKWIWNKDLATLV